MKILTLPLLERAGVTHFFGTKGADTSLIEGVRVQKTLRQIHGHQIVVASEDSSAPATGDGWVTDQPGVLLTISTADCLPILLVDPDVRAVSAIHAGWRGTVLNIAAQGVATLREVYGSQPASLLAGIGPGIGRCCFEVGHDVWQPIAKNYPYGKSVIVHKPSEKAWVDLVQLNRFQLMEAGLLPERIASLDLCTVCQASQFHSYRRDKTRTGSMINGVMLTQTD